MKNKSILFWVASLSLVASVCVHFYLTNHHYSFKYSSEFDGGGVCNISAKFNCNATTASNYSEFLGIPISIFGGLINLVLLGLLMAFRFPIVSSQTQGALGSPIKWLALFIFGSSLVMGAISLVALNTICPMCSLAYLLSLVTVGSIWLHIPGSLALNTFTMKSLAISGVSILALAYVVNHNQLKSFGGKEIKEITQLQLEEWKSRPTKNLTPISPVTMNASKNAKMKIVEFADFLCGHCASAFPVIHNFVKTHPDVEFSFQAFPLDGECNKAIGRASGLSCRLARIAHCAGKQDKAWEMQEWIFKNQRQLLSKEAIEQQMKTQSERLGLNFEEMKSCEDSQETRQAISAQADLGTEVGVKGTPSLYVNGKKVPGGFSIPLLNAIYFHTLIDGPDEVGQTRK